MCAIRDPGHLLLILLTSCHKDVHTYTGALTYHKLFAHRSVYTHKSIYTSTEQAVSHRNFDTQKLSHTEAFGTKDFPQTKHVHR